MATFAQILCAEVNSENFSAFSPGIAQFYIQNFVYLSPKINEAKNPEPVSQVEEIQQRGGFK